MENLKNLFDQNPAYTSNISVTLGPEGGFSSEEEDLLHQANFTPYRLTPTILRSREAVCLGLGAVRASA